MRSPGAPNGTTGGGAVAPTGRVRCFPCRSPRRALRWSRPRQRGGVDTGGTG